MSRRNGRFPRLLLILSFWFFGPATVWGNPLLGTADAVRISPVQPGGAAPAGLVQRQLQLRDQLATYLRSYQESHSAGPLFMILGVSFLYGILHALGPGHRKTVILSIYLARTAPWWEPLASSLALSGLHAGTAIVLLLAFSGVTQSITVATDTIVTYLEGGTYCLLIAMAGFLLVRSIINLVRDRVHGAESVSLGTLILTGIYPCPGAILVLVLSLTLRVMGMGILAVAAMSLGMSIPIAGFAYLGWMGRTGVLGVLRNNEGALRRAGAIVEVAGFSILMLISVYLALPFMASLLALVR